MGVLGSLWLAGMRVAKWAFSSEGDVRDHEAEQAFQVVADDNTRWTGVG